MGYSAFFWRLSSSISALLPYPPDRMVPSNIVHVITFELNKLQAENMQIQPALPALNHFTSFFIHETIADPLSIMHPLYCLQQTKTNSIAQWHYRSGGQWYW